MSGEIDTLDGAKGTIEYMKQLLAVDSDFWNQERKIFFYDNDKVGGYYYQKGNFTYVTVPKSGHFMPYDNYDASKAILDHNIKNGRIQCHNSENNCSVAEDLCSMMNDCGDNGLCLMNGQCMCNDGYKGADCSF
jgi:hypothetical protein